ncbi:metal-dependent hydrolase [Legionella tunisiensis]|uniref:metal-dependent hydrolase n=1 Tax=Legionella tunisiensis TaxID=1034944 RepID=UPI0002F3EA83
MAALIGYATHGLLDACTNYGTVLFWPFSERRVYWDLISIIDPFFTVPLVLGVAWTVIHDTRVGVILGLTLAGLVLFLILYNTTALFRLLKFI